jgi:hypothetical protein
MTGCTSTTVPTVLNDSPPSVLLQKPEQLSPLKSETTVNDLLLLHIENAEKNARIRLQLENLIDWHLQRKSIVDSSTK